MPTPFTSRGSGPVVYPVKGKGAPEGELGWWGDGVGTQPEGLHLFITCMSHLYTLHTDAYHTQPHLYTLCTDTSHTHPYTPTLLYTPHKHVFCVPNMLHTVYTSHSTHTSTLTPHIS